MKAMQRYENSGGCIALTFMLAFFFMTLLMGHAGYQQTQARKRQCQAEGAEFVWRSRSENFCVKPVVKMNSR